LAHAALLIDKGYGFRHRHPFFLSAKSRKIRGITNRLEVNYTDIMRNLQPIFAWERNGFDTNS
ncbi:MAG: hypothetical protein SOY66_00785, partial [Evtepia sp.]|nr:hypothetical protein [Evtepia sp.]